MWYWEYSDLVIILDTDSSATKFVLAEFISIQNFSNLGMPSKKKKSIWRDIVPTRGGGGKNKLQNVPT